MKEDSDASLQIVILLILGMFMLLFGALLFAIYSGKLPYNPDSTYGLFLVIVSLQVVTMGKTPFGDFRRSWALIIVGTGTAIVGMVACFIPGSLTEFLRTLIGVVLLASGLTLFFRLSFSEQKARTWWRIGGILQQLTIACGLVYALTVVVGIVTLFPTVATNRQVATLLIGYGASFFYLTWCIWEVSKSYPAESPATGADNVISKARFGIFQTTSLPLSIAILILLGVLLTLLGLLLFPVNFGLLPFSPDGQLGLLLTIMAIQILALGDTPLGQFERSWLIIIVGVVFAALGVVSSIVPGVLTEMIRVLLGFLNVIGGGVSLMKRYLPMLQGDRAPPATPANVSPIRRMMAAQTALNGVAVAFGISVLVPGLLPGLLIAVILVVNGVLLFILATILRKVVPVGNSNSKILMV